MDHFTFCTFCVQNLYTFQMIKLLEFNLYHEQTSFLLALFRLLFRRYTILFFNNLHLLQFVR